LVLALSAAAAYAGVGEYFAVAGTSALGAGAVGAGTYFAVYGPGHHQHGEVSGPLCWSAIVVGGGAAAYAGGELLCGRSANPWASLASTFGGAAIGGGVSFLIFAAVFPWENVDDAPSEPFPYVPIGGFFTLAAVPFMSAAFYVATKEPAAASGALPVTPTVAFLPPRAPGETATPVVGVAWGF
jgi:hypothetical protein